MPGRDHEFFPLEQIDDGEEFVRDIVDLCFSLAYFHRQHPDAFLAMDFDDLEFYSRFTKRFQKRLRGG